MTDDLREVLAEAYEAAGYSDEASAFCAGEWTCHDHPALHALRQVERRAFERAAGEADADARQYRARQNGLTRHYAQWWAQENSAEAAEELAARIRALAAPALTEGGAK